MTERVVRCPYTIGCGYEFRPMIALAEGAFVCAKCGHLEIPNAQRGPQVSLLQMHRVPGTRLPSLRVKSTGMYCPESDEP